MGDSGSIGAYSNTGDSTYRYQGPAQQQQPQSNYAGGAATAIGGLTSAYAQYSAGRYNQKMARLNAEASRQQAIQAEQAGTLAANRVAGRERQIEGADASAAAAGGTVVGAGTNRAVIESNRAASAMDQYMIELNARREAWGYQTRAVGQELQGDQARLQGEMGAASTLIRTANSEYYERDRSHPDQPVF